MDEERAQENNVTVALRFAVLGPVRCWQDSREVATGSPQQQALLAALLLRKDHVITTDDLIRMVWDDQPPATALGTVRTYISRLRRLLKATAARIDAIAGGYTMRGDGISVDLWELQAAMAQLSGRAAQRADPQALEVLARVFTTWSGTALEGVPGDWAEAQRVRLDGLRITAVEALMSQRLRENDSRADEFQALYGLVEAHPLHEGLRSLLMLALHRTGRRAEALEVFHVGARRLREDLGLSPGPALQEAQSRILQDDVVPTSTDPRTSAQSVNYLPAMLGDFVGRARELAAIRYALTTPGAVVGITGTGGSGRTSLAVLATHRLAEHFPDGQLFCDVDEAGDIDGVLAQLIRLLGGDPATLESTQARAATLNQLASQRQVLALVDNVSQADDIQLLRRAMPHATLIFTSLRRFHGLADITWLRLRALSQPESLDLFAAVAGSDRIVQAPQAAQELVALSGGYALAVRVFAQRVRDLPHWSVAAISSNMEHEMAQPYASGHDDCQLLAAPVERSYAALRPDAARLLRVLGILPDEEISSEELGELLGIPLHQVFFGLAAGSDLSLLDESAGEHRYRMSDPVVRTVMMRLAYASEGPEEVARLRAAHQSTLGVLT